MAEMFEHKWLFVIIPVTEGHHEGGPYGASVPTTQALLAAYCKHCDTYYTKPLPWSAQAPLEGHAGLPRWGCISPEGRF